MRVAILGGTFDPIHLGHMAMARYVLSQQYCDEVWFMVAKDTPLKQRKILPMDIRIHMCELALAPFKKMRVCTLEKDIPGVSYTLHTVKKLYELYPNITFSWLIGDDQADNLDKWKGIDELLRLIEFWIFPRTSQEIQCAYPHQKMKKELLDVSSSDIRSGRKFYLLPKTLQIYLGQHPIYMQEYVRTRLSEKRYAHTQRVTKLCMQLAKIHGVQVHHAYMAGMLHDICKEWDMKRSTEWMKQLEPMHMKEPSAIWHAYIAATYCSHAFAVHNKDVARAIYYHTVGSNVSLLTMILYIADKIEPGRNYDTSELTLLAKHDLTAAYVEIQRQQVNYLKKEIIHE